MNSEMNNGLNQIVGELQQTRNHRSDQEIQLATLLEMGKQVLLTGKPITITDNNSRDLMTPEGTNNQMVSSDETMTPIDLLANFQAQDDNSTDGVTELEQHKAYILKPKHKSLADLMSEWVSIGDFQDGFGGIEGRNKKFGASWRKHLPHHSYSRTERTVKGIRAYAKQNKISDFDASRQLQEAFEQQKCSISNMVNYFIAQGLLPKKKPRGKIRAPRSVSPSPANHGEL
jgi:Transcriptional activator of glycolytic enzymes